jgi:hypothetical protein
MSEIILLKENVEQPLIEPIIDFSFLTESSVGKEKTYYIEGIFMQSEKINGNLRKYQLEEMRKESDRYNIEKIANRSGWGELDHPQTTNMNMSKMCHLFVNPLRMEGNDVVGKAKILDNIWGQIVKTAIDEKIPFGVSSRGRGIAENKKDFQLITNFKLVTPADIVENPSAPDARPTAFSEMLIEAVVQDYKKITSGLDDELVYNVKKTIHNSKKVDLDETIIKAYWNIINSIKST